MQCQYVKPSGEICEANAINESQFCFSHDPESADQKSLAVQKGGLNRRLCQIYGEPVEIASPEDIKKLLAITINQIRTGQMPASQPANSLAYLSRCWLDAHQMTEMEEKIGLIEDRLEKAHL